MSWLFSQALVEEFSAGTSLDGQPCAQLNVMPTRHKFWRNDKMIEHCDLSQFGLTSQLLTEDHGVELLTSFLAAFPVRISAQRPVAELSGSAGQEVDCGPKWFASFAKYSHDSSMWKTHQFSLLGDLDEFSQTWPRSGLMRHGECWELPMLVQHTNAHVSGYWPTPSKSDTADRKVPDHVHTTKTGSIKHIGKDGSLSQIRLSQVVKFRTPNASDARKWSRQTEEERRAKGQQVRLGHQLGAGGQLNPDWVEWLMGWPIGWTDLRPLAMDKFREWQQQHGRFSADET